MCPQQPRRLDGRPSIGAPACGAPPQPGQEQPEALVCLLEPRGVQSPSPPFPQRVRHTGAGLGRFPGLLPHRLFRLPFCWTYQFSRFPGWLCFNLSPWSRLRRLPLSPGQEEMEGPRVSRAGSGASGFPGTDAGIAQRLRGPANLPPSKLAR